MTEMARLTVGCETPYVSASSAWNAITAQVRQRDHNGQVQAEARGRPGRITAINLRADHHARIGDLGLLSPVVEYIIGGLSSWGD